MSDKSDLTDQLVEAIQFCFEKAALLRGQRINSVPLAERIDYLCELRDRSGKVRVAVGRDARRRLYAWSKDFLERRKWTHLADPTESEKWLAEEIAHRFFGKRTQVSRASVSRLMSRFEKFIEDGVQRHRYLWPCHICYEQEPKELFIGNVRFRPMREAKSDIDEGLSSWGKEPDGFVEETIREYFDAFGWIADVCVHTTDAVAAKRMSLNAVRLSLAILKLFYGGSAKSRLRVSDQQNFLLGRAELYFTDEPHLSWSSSSPQEPFPENWWDDINQGENALRIQVLGKVVEATCDPSKLNFLKRKILNGLIWFDDATTDTHPGARISKYVNAIEAIAGCGERKDLADQVGERVSCMLANWPEEGRFDEIFEKVKKTYRVRSELVHGERDPLGHDLDEFVSLAGHLAHMSIIAFTDFTLRINVDRNDYDNVRQAEAFRIMRQIVSRSEDRDPAK